MVSMNIRVIIPVILFSLIISGCSQRMRNNPLDPQNPVTKGRPTGLTAVSQKHSVILSWNPVSLNGVLGYNLYRWIPEMSKSKKVFFIPSDSSSFTDIKLPYDQRITYCLSVVSSGYESPLSDSVFVTPGPYNYWLVDNYDDTVFRLSYDGMHVLAQTCYIPQPRAVSADSSSQTAWVVNGLGYLFKFSSSGDVLLTIKGLDRPSDLNVDLSDNLIWIVDQNSTAITRYDLNGNFIGITKGFGEVSDISVDSSSEGCWVVDIKNKKVVLLSIDGEQKLSVDCTAPRAVSCYHQDGWVWVADSLRMLRIWSNGNLEKVMDLNFPLISLSVDQKTGDCWGITKVNTKGENEVVKFNTEGILLTRVEGFYYARSLVANSFNGGCLVVDTGHGRLVRLSKNGNIISILNSFFAPWDIAVE